MKKTPFWNKFVAVAQPYWYSVNATTDKYILPILLISITFFCLSFFSLTVATLALIGQQHFPNILTLLAPGLIDLTSTVIHSSGINIIRLSCIVPLVIFSIYWKNLKYHWQAWSTLTLLLFILLCVSGINIISSYVGRDLVTAIANKHASGYFHILFVYTVVLIATTIIVVISNYLRKKIAIYWLEWLGNYFLQKYFLNRSYYHLNANPDIDNPDQRIADGIASWTQTSMNLFLVIFNQLIDLIAFCGILWSISKLLVFVLIAYAIFGNLFTTFLSQKLINLNFQQLESEANFRYSLVRVRNHAESIAFYGGEKQEALQAKQRFYTAVKNSNQMINWQRNIELFSTGYNYLIMVIPYVVVAPLFLEGKVELGVITQATIACNQVLGALSVVVSQFESISSFAAVTNRLGDFLEVLNTPATPYQNQALINNTNIIYTIESDDESNIRIYNLTLETPNHERTLIKDLSISINQGDNLLIMGNSGSGKSSLLRALGGLWINGTGTIIRPKLEKIMFLPQRPYMVQGTLKDQLIYPHNRNITDIELDDILQQVNLQSLPSRVGGLDIELNWDDILSLGEQQRIAFARLLLASPQYAILDEATSALDLKNEEHLYQKLHQANITFISVGHRSSLVKYHQQILEILDEANWRHSSTISQSLKV